MSRTSRGWSAALAVALSMIVTTGSAAAAPIEPCLNDMHREEAGRVEIDLRPDRFGAFTTLTVFWFIDEVPARPGAYFWNHVITERTTSAVHIDDKDDNLRTALPMLDELGRPRI